jgi:ABC-type nickel/cobalt efflux system permease component RcnA
MSFFLSERPLLLKGLILGNMFAFLHTGSAVVLVVIMRFIIQKTSVVAADEATLTIMMISYGLLTVIGLVLFVSKIRSRNHIHTHTPAGHTNDHYSRSMVSMAVALGVVPCPGTTLILLFCLSLGMLPFGIMLVLAMGAGMAITISCVGLVTIVMKKQVLSLLSANEKIARIITRIIELVGALFLFLAGLALFVSSLP